MPDIFFINSSGIFLLIIFPNIIASKSLITIPIIAPMTNGILYFAYCIPSPIAARNVLSPSSPTAMLIAIINM